MIPQVNIGRLIHLRPLALSLATVTMKFTVPTVTDAVSISIPAPASVAPTWGVYTAVFRGAYIVHPKSAAPPGVKKLAIIKRPPNTRSQ